MYIRFESRFWDDGARANDGVFMASWRVCDSWFGQVDRPWQVLELERQREWFCTNLKVPSKLWYRPGRKACRGGLCWFRHEAREHINRARYMAFLVEDLGEKMVERLASDPGVILWRDHSQVVALAQ